MKIIFFSRKGNCVMMLIRLILVIISQYVHISNHYIPKTNKMLYANYMLIKYILITL